MLWGKPKENGRRTCLDPKLAATAFEYRVSERDNHYPNGEDLEFGSWDKSLASGRSYPVGESTPMREL
jgi:hypothetical protein